MVSDYYGYRTGKAKFVFGGLICAVIIETTFGGYVFSKHGIDHSYLYVSSFAFFLAALTVFSAIQFYVKHLARRDS